METIREKDVQGIDKEKTRSDVFPKAIMKWKKTPWGP